MASPIHIKNLPISPADRTWGLYARSIEQLLNESYPFSDTIGKTSENHVLLFLSEGEATIMVESSKKKKSLPLSSGDAVILCPGQWHRIIPSDKSLYLEYRISFGGEAAERILDENCRNSGYQILHTGDPTCIRDLYLEAMGVADRKESGFQMMLGSLIGSMLAKAYCLDRNRTFCETGLTEKISQTMQIIESEYRTITPEQISKRLCMSYSNFRKIFKQYTGYSPAVFILEKRMNRVKEILVSTDLQLKEIAEMEAFENYEYFLTCFKASTGVSPSQYRENFRNGLCE